jgi:hypothetical protein
LRPHAFTCLLPVHAGDRADWFAEAIDSVGANGLAPWAIFICQDGPLPPELEAAVAAGERRWSARRMVNPGPRGLHHNLNHALAEVATPLACRADSDDVNLPGRFEAQARFLAAHPDIAVVGAAIEEVGPDGARRRKALPLTHDRLVRFAAWRNPINHMTAFFRVDAVRAAGGYPPIPLKEDYALWLRMITRGMRLANLPQVLVQARLGEGFHRRRAGPGHLAAERALHQVRREVRQIGPVRASASMALRAAALTLETPARLIYAAALRR